MSKVESGVLTPRAPVPIDRPGPFQLFMLVLCVYALGALAAESFAPVSADTRKILEYADNVVCSLFFADFLQQLARAPNRWRYFVQWGWIDLLSSVPMVDALRVGRAARLLRIVRVLRAVRSTRIIASMLLRRRAEGVFLAATLLSLLLVVASSIAILQFEQVESANIKTAQDAFWWAFVTITTVGYGDRFPVTSEGRVIAGMLMTAGVGLFGTFSGFVASWFLSSGERQQESETEALRKEIRALREAIELGASHAAPSRRSGVDTAPPES